MRWFETLGFRCPKSKDPADYLQEVTSEETNAPYRISDEELAEAGISRPRSASEFARRFAENELAKAANESLQAKLEKCTARERSAPSSRASIVKRRPSSSSSSPPSEVSLAGTQADEIIAAIATMPKFRQPSSVTFSLVLRRQYALLLRNKVFLGAHLVGNVFLGLVYGSAWFDQPIDLLGGLNQQFLIQNVMQYIGLSSFSLISVIMKQRQVYYKQKAEAFYPSWTYVVADIAAFLPIPLIDSFSIATMVYWMAGMPDDVPTFFTYILGMIMWSLFFAMLVRSFCYLNADMNSATGAAMGSLFLMALSMGLVVNPSLLTSSWLAWLYWANPQAWLFRSLLQNNLHSPGPWSEPCPGSGNLTCGNAVLESLAFPTEEWYLWAGFGVLCAYLVVFSAISTLALSYVVFDGDRGAVVAAAAADPDDDDSGGEGSARNRKYAPNPEALASIGFESVSLAFRELWYTIEIVNEDAPRSIDILKGVSGHAEPRQLTALMGSSGAGKTTLLDVLAGRKTTGTIKGEIFAGGFPKEDGAFRRMTGYVEQFSALLATDTVYETLEFVASLRLPATTTREQRRAIIADASRA